MERKYTLEVCSIFQSTPPRGWRHNYPSPAILPREISIHSTARVETLISKDYIDPRIISIHSTARVETVDTVQNLRSLIYFNPLHREGGDKYPLEYPHLNPRFQSTPPRGWRLRHNLSSFTLTKFQSTPPRGWRQYFLPHTHQHIQFQSTPPRGWRLSSLPSAACAVPISIHSTARVETFFDISIAPFSIFQSTPPRGWRHHPYFL